MTATLNMTGPSGQQKSLLVAYGTETGKSQDIAEELGDMAERMRCRTHVMAMEDVALKDLLKYSLVIFVTSTTGQGEMPRNVVKFWKSLLRKALPKDCLKGVNFTMFGLGDSSYTKFNWAARKLQRRLLQLAASEFLAPGEADERHDNGIDSIYRPWYRELKAFLAASLINEEPVPDEQLLPPKFPLHLASMESSATPCSDSDVPDEKSAALSHVDGPQITPRCENGPPAVNVAYHARSATNGAASSVLAGPLRVDSLDKDNILTDRPEAYNITQSSEDIKVAPAIQLPIPGTYTCEVMSNDRMTPDDHWQDVRRIMLHLQFDNDDMANDICELDPGSTVLIYPKNFPGDVQTLIELMHWENIADRLVEWRRNGIAQLLPRGCYAGPNFTLRNVLTHNLDITAVPTRWFLKEMRRHSDSDRERERLQELTTDTADREQEFYDYTSRPRRTILEVLRDFPSVKIPLDYALQVFPVIKPREFSIATGGDCLRPKNDDSKLYIEIVAALVEYKTIIRKPRQGLCSRYLRTLRPGTQIGVSLKVGTNLACDSRLARRPLIAIATGTGIAPIRSIIQDRTTFGRTGPTLLFFGCRNEHADFHFSHEWYSYPNITVIPAFSRDPIKPTEQVLTQPDLIRPNEPYIPVQDRPPVTPIVADAVAQAAVQTSVADQYDRGKMYVQHRIREHAREICDVLRDAKVEPLFVICGNGGRMPTSVRLALVDAFVLGGLSKTKEEAHERLMKSDVWQETW